MGKPPDTLPTNPLPDLPICATLFRRNHRHESQQARIFAPWLAGLPAARRDLLALLPVLDVNGAFSAALGDTAPDGETAPRSAHAGMIAALLCVDPFLRVRDITALLGANNISGVANFPTIQIIDGVAALGFDSADLGVRREAQILARFADEGLAVTGFATSADNGLRLLDHGASALVVHPGPPSSDWRNRAIAARGAADTLQALRAHCQGPLRLFCPEAYGAELDPARALADGLVIYG